MGRASMFELALCSQRSSISSVGTCSDTKTFFQGISKALHLTYLGMLQMLTDPNIASIDFTMTYNA